MPLLKRSSRLCGARLAAWSVELAADAPPYGDVNGILFQATAASNAGNADVALLVGMRQRRRVKAIGAATLVFARVVIDQRCRSGRWFPAIIRRLFSSNGALCFSLMRCVVPRPLAMKIIPICAGRGATYFACDKTDLLSPQDSTVALKYRWQKAFADDHLALMTQTVKIPAFVLGA